MLKGLGRTPVRIRARHAGRPAPAPRRGDTPPPAGTEVPPPAAPCRPPPPPVAPRRREAAKEPDPADRAVRDAQAPHPHAAGRPARHEPGQRDGPEHAPERDPRRRRAPLRHREPAAQPQRAPAAGQRDPRRDVRLRPARAAAQGREDRRHHDQRAEEDLRREGGPDPALGGRLPRQRAPAPDHRPDRLAGRPARRRDLADGRRPPAQRLAVQRDHPAAGARRRRGHDPDVRLAAADQGRPAPVQGVHARDARADGRGDEGAAERHHLGRHRLGQDDPAEHALELHPDRPPRHHDRGRRRAAAPAGPRGAARDPPRRTSKAGARSPRPTWSRTPCVCGPTGSSSASAAAPRRST